MADTPPIDRDLDAVIPLVYAKLREMALARLRRSPLDSLSPTELLNEAYLRMARQQELPIDDRSEFFAIAARVIRNTLVDLARARRAKKRGAKPSRITLSDAHLARKDDAVDLMELHEALERLGSIDTRQARIAELRIFGGLSIREISRVMEVSRRTVDDELTLARAWLRREIFDR